MHLYLFNQIENPLESWKDRDDVDYPLHVRNKERTLIGFIEKKFNEEIYSEIVDVVKRQGWKGTQAFFYAIVEKTGTNNDVVKINLSRVLPVESW